MGMSHAAGVWIPSLGLNAATVEAVVKKACKEEGLQFQLFERSEPKTTCLVTPLDEREDINMEFDLLNPVATALSKKLKLPTYALFAFFGSGDWMQVTAFSAQGKKRWQEGSDENADTKALTPVAKKLGLTVWSPDGDDDDGGEQVNGVTFPYWRMMSEVSKPPCTEDLVGLCIKPAFDLGFVDGWKVVHEFES